ncbi:hypothetical protein JYU34_020786 [Plutella xylostella]|uniref:Uncharacterized protein n=1 Tax=Plutella xylostella TaxID=51655 RepID=A0ABQ7PRZ4_PLUXY|nr:hypothetical protein JYU34_020786 [Plutella xylostella]
MCEECGSGRRQQGGMSCDMARCVRIDYPTSTTCAPPTHRPPPSVCPESTTTCKPPPLVFPEPTTTCQPPPPVCPEPTSTRYPPPPPPTECTTTPPRPRPPRPRPTQPPRPTYPPTPLPQQPDCYYMQCWMPMCCGNFRCANNNVNNFRRAYNNININMVPSALATTEDEFKNIYLGVPKEQRRHPDHRRSGGTPDVDIMNVL